MIPVVAITKAVLSAIILLVCFAANSSAGGPHNTDASKPDRAGTILFSCLGGLCVIQSDGSGFARITRPEDHCCFSASWSPDGSKIAYVSNRLIKRANGDQKNVSLWVINAEGSVVTRLTAEPGRAFYHVAWSPDGRKMASVSLLFDIAKDRTVTQLNSNIWVVNADGSKAGPITRLSNHNIYIDNVTWSPDGRRIAFISNRALDGGDAEEPDGESRNLWGRNIWVMDADGSHAKPLTRLNAKFVRVLSIAWSPDSRTLAYLSNRVLDGGNAEGGGTNIWLANVDGSPDVPLTRFTKASCSYFSWSPDGSRLAFSSNEGLDGSDTGNSPINLWAVKSAGSSPVPLTSDTAFESHKDEPAWSPDGSMIAFVSCIDPSNINHATSSTCDLWVMKSDGTAAKQLTDRSIVKSAALPRWRP